MVCRSSCVLTVESLTALERAALAGAPEGRKGQSMSKAGPSLLRTMFYRAADTARRQDPQLARIYYVQMTERGATPRKACCIVAGHLAERAWAVLHRGTPMRSATTTATPSPPAEAKKIIAERWTVPEDIRKRRRNRKTAGKALSRPSPGRANEAAPPGPRSSRPLVTRDRLLASGNMKMTAISQAIITGQRSRRSVLANRLPGTGRLVRRAIDI